MLVVQEQTFPLITSPPQSQYYNKYKSLLLNGHISLLYVESAAV